MTSETVKYLGAYIGQNSTMNTHASKKCAGICLKINASKGIYLKTPSRPSHLDYSNSMSINCTNKIIKSYNLVRSSKNYARKKGKEIVHQKVLKLYWLPIMACCKFKIF